MAADTIVNFSVLFKLFDEEFLREKQVQLMTFATEIANGYIWQKDKFGLQLEISPSKSGNICSISLSVKASGKTFAKEE